MTEDEEFEADEKARIADLHRTAPETIWLQIDSEAEQFNHWDDQTWCSDKINDTDLEYVRRDLAPEICEKCGQRRRLHKDQCLHCITEWCKDKVKEARAERDELVAALDEAATSLETIHLRSYGDESYLNHMDQVRGFAGSRVGVAKEVLAKVRKTNEP